MPRRRKSPAAASGTTPTRLAREAAARARLTGAYEKFMTEGDPVTKSEAGADLIRAIFGRDAIGVSEEQK